MTLSYKSSSKTVTCNHTNKSALILPATDCIIQPQVSLANYTSYRVGGEAQWYVAPSNWEDIEAVFEWYLEQEDLPLTLLGAGSNLLVSDRGIPGLVLSTRHLRYTEFDPATGQVTVAAGEPIAKIAWSAAKRGWSGLEWAVGIPGTVGGAVVMNAGAHHSCTADILVSAVVVSPTGKVAKLTAAELGYGYRTSSLQNDQRLVIEANFQLQPGHQKAEIMATTNTNLKQRKSSQPYELPSCGSVFRNPSPQAAGWLIEQIGLKGYQIGGAFVAQRHANFILNNGSATADDIFRLIRYIQEQVEYHWSVYLEPEVKMLGEFEQSLSVVN